MARCPARAARALPSQSTRRVAICRTSSTESHSLFVELEYVKPSGNGLPSFQFSGPHHGWVGLITYMSGISTALRDSSEEISDSWSFSPGRMPVTSISHPGASALARSTLDMLGILVTNTSPPCMAVRELHTKLTPWSRLS